jgi:hypothetical protein
MTLLRNIIYPSKFIIQTLNRRNGTIKARGIVVIDYDIDGGFREAAEEQSRLEEAVAAIVKGNKRVVFHQVDMKERRGDQSPDISKMKFRQN